DAATDDCPGPVADQGTPTAAHIVDKLSLTQPPPPRLLRLAAAIDHLHSALGPPPEPYHITALETLALLYALLALAPHLRACRSSFAIRTDCTTTIAAVLRQSSGSPVINRLAQLL